MVHFAALTTVPASDALSAVVQSQQGAPAGAHEGAVFAQHLREQQAEPAHEQHEDAARALSKSLQDRSPVQVENESSPDPVSGTSEAASNSSHDDGRIDSGSANQSNESRNDYAEGQSESSQEQATAVDEGQTRESKTPSVVQTDESIPVGGTADSVEQPVGLLVDNTAADQAHIASGKPVGVATEQRIALIQKSVTHDQNTEKTTSAPTQVTHEPTAPVRTGQSIATQNIPGQSEQGESTTHEQASQDHQRQSRPEQNQKRESPLTQSVLNDGRASESAQQSVLTVESRNGESDERPATPVHQRTEHADASVKTSHEVVPVASTSSRVSQVPLAETLTGPMPQPTEMSQEAADAKAFQAAASRGLTAALRQSGGMVTIRLVPETLGAMRIHMNVDGNRVALQLETGGGRAHELLSMHMATLRAGLEQRGLKVDEMSTRIVPELARVTSEPAPPSQQTAHESRERTHEEEHAQGNGHETYDDRNERDHSGSARDDETQTQWDEEFQHKDDDEAFAPVEQLMLRLNAVA